MPELDNYVMFVHHSFRIAVCGDFTDILKLLKNIGKEEYDKHVKELCESISSGSSLEFIGEYIDGEEMLHFVFIDNSSDLIDVAQGYFEANGIHGRVSKIIFSNEVEKNSPICIKEGFEDDMLAPMTWRESFENGIHSVDSNYPYIYNVLNPIFEKNNTETTQCSESHCCSCCDE